MWRTSGSVAVRTAGGAGVAGVDCWVTGKTMNCNDDITENESGAT